MDQVNVVAIVKWILGLTGLGVSTLMVFYLKKILTTRDRKRVVMECKIDTGDHMFTDHLGEDVGGKYKEELDKRKSEAGIS